MCMRNCYFGTADVGNLSFVVDEVKKYYLTNSLIPKSDTVGGEHVGQKLPIINR